MPTPVRHIRISDDLYEAAQVKAASEGRTVSDVIRDYLKRWTAQPGKGQR